jgi:hypothetical protein
MTEINSYPKVKKNQIFEILNIFVCAGSKIYEVAKFKKSTKY